MDENHPPDAAGQACSDLDHSLLGSSSSEHSYSARISGIFKGVPLLAYWPYAVPYPS